MWGSRPLSGIFLFLYRKPRKPKDRKVEFSSPVGDFSFFITIIKCIYRALITFSSPVGDFSFFMLLNELITNMDRSLFSSPVGDFSFFIIEIYLYGYSSDLFSSPVGDFFFI